MYTLFTTNFVLDFFCLSYEKHLTFLYHMTTAFRVLFMLVRRTCRRLYCTIVRIQRNSEVGDSLIVSD